MADIIGSYERSRRCENNIDQDLVLKTPMVTTGDPSWLGNPSLNNALRASTPPLHFPLRPWIMPLLCEPNDAVRAVAVAKRREYFCTKKVHVKMIWQHFLYNFMVLLDGPVQDALFCLMDRYRNVCVWFTVPKGWNSLLPTWEPQVTIARNCRFPEVGTHVPQPGNQRLPLQATAGSQRLELMLPNLGTIGYHCKELPIPKGWNWWFPRWEPKVTMARNCRFPDLKTYGSQPGNQRLLLQGINGSQKLRII